MKNHPYVIASQHAAPKSVVGGVHVYVLCFGFKGRDIPFYVGQAQDLNHRFAKHDRISWHHAAFKDPVRIHVVGQVAKDHVDVAEQDLISLMINANFILTNSVITDHDARRLNRSRLKLEQASLAEILSYLASPATPLFELGDLHEWRLEWFAKPTAGDFINTQLLRSLLLQFPSGLSGLERSEHERLTSAYDFQLGRAVLSFTDGEVSRLENLWEVWDFAAGESERAQRGFQIYLQQAAVKAVRQAAAAVDPHWMSSSEGESSIASMWAPSSRYQPYLDAKRQVDRLLKELWQMELAGAEPAELAIFKEELLPYEESLEAMKRRLDEKYPGPVLR